MNDFAVGEAPRLALKKASPLPDVIDDAALPGALVDAAAGGDSFAVAQSLPGTTTWTYLFWGAVAAVTLAAAAVMMGLLLRLVSEGVELIGDALKVVRTIERSLNAVPELLDDAVDQIDDALN